MLNKETIFKNKRDAYLSAILLNLYTYTDFNDKFAKIIIIIKHWKSRAKWKKNCIINGKWCGYFPVSLSVEINFLSMSLMIKFLSLDGV